MCMGLGLYMKDIWGLMAKVRVADGQWAERNGRTNNKGNLGWMDGELR